MALALNYSGPSSLNKFLHSFPHCSFKHGCHSLSFSDDAPAMVEPHEQGDTWLESILMIICVPFALVALYLLIDVIVRWVIHCCRRSQTGNISHEGRACCFCCCPSQASEDEEDLFPPSSRIPFSSRSFASRSKDGFPAAVESLPPPSLAGTHNPKRGGVAGQMSDSFHYQRSGSAAGEGIDPSNPFHTSSRLIAVSGDRHDPVLDADVPAPTPVNPDKRYDCRMLTAVIFAIASIALLAASIAMSQRYESKWSDVHTDLTSSRDYFQGALQDYGVALLEDDVENTNALLQQLLIDGGISPKPFTNDQKAAILALSQSYSTLSTDVFQRFTLTLANQTNNMNDIRTDMDNIETVRRDTTYALLSLMLIALLGLVFVHMYYRRKPCLSLCSSSVFALLLVGVAWVATLGIGVSVAVSDVCMDPLVYTDSFLNSSTVHKSDSVTSKAELSTSLNDQDVAILDFYLNCPQYLDHTSNIDNPLFKEFIVPASMGLNDITPQLRDVLTFIQTNRSDFEVYVQQLTTINTTMFMDLSAVSSNLQCETVHGYFVDGMQAVCHPLLEALWTQSAMLFVTCILLLLIRCLVWMRVKRHDLLDEEEDPEASHAASVHKVPAPYFNTTSSSPYRNSRNGSRAGNDEAGAALFGTGSTNFSAPSNYMAM